MSARLGFASVVPHFEIVLSKKWTEIAAPSPFADANSPCQDGALGEIEHEDTMRAGTSTVGMSPALRAVMRTILNTSYQVSYRPPVFAINAEPQSPSVSLLECVVPLA